MGPGTESCIGGSGSGKVGPKTIKNPRIKVHRSPPDSLPGCATSASESVKSARVRELRFEIPDYAAIVSGYVP